MSSRSAARFDGRGRTEARGEVVEDVERAGQDLVSCLAALRGGVEGCRTGLYPRFSWHVVLAKQPNQVQSATPDDRIAKTHQDPLVLGHGLAREHRPLTLRVLFRGPRPSKMRLCGHVPGLCDRTCRRQLEGSCGGRGATYKVGRGQFAKKTCGSRNQIPGSTRTMALP